MPVFHFENIYTGINAKYIFNTININELIVTAYTPTDCASQEKTKLKLKHGRTLIIRSRSDVN